MKSVFMAPRFPTLCPFSSAENLHTFSSAQYPLISLLGNLPARIIRVPKWGVLPCVIMSSRSWEATKPKLKLHKPGTREKFTEWGTRTGALHPHVSCGTYDINCTYCYNKSLLTLYNRPGAMLGIARKLRAKKVQMLYSSLYTQPVAWNKVSAQYLLNQSISHWYKAK